MRFPPAFREMPMAVMIADSAARCPPHRRHRVRFRAKNLGIVWLRATKINAARRIRYDGALLCRNHRETDALLSIGAGKS
jgi:hypothetical protein